MLDPSELLLIIRRHELLLCIVCLAVDCSDSGGGRRFGRLEGNLLGDVSQRLFVRRLVRKVRVRGSLNRRSLSSPPQTLTFLTVRSHNGIRCAEFRTFEALSKPSGG